MARSVKSIPNNGTDAATSAKSRASSTTAASRKKTTLHMIGNAHIDPVWLWQWQEGFHEVHASFRSALDRMNEYDDFTFVSSSAQFYEWIEQGDPPMFAEIQQRVAEGRWQIVGGWWIQPDCNIPGGESFVRHGLYGQRYFKSRFGVTAKVGYNVDSFGHNGMLPQILKKSGMDYYVFMRPGPQEKGLPGRLFWWESHDGSRVLTYRIPFEYCTSGKDLDKHIRRNANELKPPIDTLMCFYGVGNHGGGPTKANIENIRRLNERADPDLPSLTFSQPEAYFEAVLAKDWPVAVVHDDLQRHASGCYSAHSGIKRWNRQAENVLLAAEKFATIAATVTGQPYPDHFAQAWKSVLFNQFHDILAGTSIEPAYNDARDGYGEAMAIAARALNYAVQSLAWNINIPPEETSKPLVVYNPHAWASRVNVEIESSRIPDGYVLLDDADQQIAYQLVQSQATSGGRFRVSFIADLPPMGYRVYRFADRPAMLNTTSITASDTVMDNGHFRIEFDPDTGTIKSLRDLRLKLEVLAGAGARPVVIDDPSDTWGHNVFKFDHEVGDFKVRSVKLVEHGPVKAVIRVTSEYAASTLIQDFTMYAEIDQIDVHVTVDWHEHFKMLKLRFPAKMHFHKTTYEIPYGNIERFANGEEEPGQSWFDVSGSSLETDDLYGLSILNDGKYSFDINVRDMGLTVLRSPVYAHHIPTQPKPDGHYSFIDQGIQRFTYTLLPHAENWEYAGTVRRAAELNQRSIALWATFHAGPLPQSGSFMSVDRENMNVTVVKKAEDNDDLIVRCYETARIATHATITLAAWNRTIDADFAPCEIKTFRVPADRSLPVREVNMIEWDV